MVLALKRLLGSGNRELLTLAGRSPGLSATPVEAKWMYRTLMESNGSVRVMALRMSVTAYPGRRSVNLPSQCGRCTVQSTFLPHSNLFPYALPRPRKPPHPARRPRRRSRPQLGRAGHFQRRTARSATLDRLRQAEDITCRLKRTPFGPASLTYQRVR